MANATLNSTCRYSCWTRWFERGCGMRSPVRSFFVTTRYPADRDNAGSRGAGGDCVDVASRLSCHAWTVKELIESAREVG